MRLRTKAFHAAAHALCATRLDRAIGRWHRGIGSIFVLHSVVSDRSAYFNDQNRTSADFLDRLIRHLIADDVDIVSLNEAVSRLEGDEARPFACFTLDDGYKDNLHIALPIFERYGAPFTVFVTTCMIERTINNWWSGVAAAIKKCDAVEVPEIDAVLPTADLRSKTAVYRRILGAVEAGRVSAGGVSELLAKCGVRLEDVLGADALDIAELRTLADSPLVEIGGHTTNHPQLAKLDEASARAELAVNKAWLEDILDREIRHFAYPFGDERSCGRREAEIALEAGFCTGLTTRIGTVRNSHIRQLHALPRLRLFSEEESLTLVDFQRRGGAEALLSGMRNPIVRMQS